MVLYQISSNSNPPQVLFLKLLSFDVLFQSSSRRLNFFSFENSNFLLLSRTNVHEDLLLEIYSDIYYVHNRFIYPFYHILTSLFPPQIVPQKYLCEFFYLVHSKIVFIFVLFQKKTHYRAEQLYQNHSNA